ncbi:tetratricopeptide repeat protein [Hydrogenophaga sp. PAMC20947]|uniref:tetratricopeptide repeat protein n=1 Tax=Hydrogenophaga sp. PAMC20947 TaxID=2565558 RepID=UPI001B34A4B3|nr:tetratricopeptide repeat protein [Hydrogenophaga sp. PAMC20947]
MLLIASMAALLITGGLVFRYKSMPHGETLGAEATAAVHGDSWLHQYRQIWTTARQGSGPVDTTALSAAAPADPVSQLLMERLIATKTFQTDLKLAAFPPGRLGLKWSQYDPAALEMLAENLGEAIEQAIDAGQLKEAESIAIEVSQSGLLASGTLNPQTEMMLRVANGRAAATVSDPSHDESTKRLVKWVTSMQDQALTEALLDAQTYLAELEIRAGDFSLARERLLPLSKAVLAGKPGQERNLEGARALTMARFAGALLRVGEFQQARKVLEPYTAISTLENNCFPSMDAHLVAAEIAIEEAEFVRAESAFEQVRICLDKHHHPGYFKEARLQNGLGILYTQMGRQEDASAALNKAAEIWAKTLPPEHEWMGSLHNNLGALQRTMGHFDEARVEYDAAAGIWRASLGETHPRLATYYNNIAELGMLSGQLSEVKDALNSALQLRRDAYGDKHPWTAVVVSNMGEYLALVGQPAAALNNHRIALRIREQSLGMDHADTAMSLNNLGAVLFAGQEYRQSLESFTRAVAINRKLYGDGHPQTWLTKLNLAINNMALGDNTAAEMWLKQIADNFDSDAPPSRLQISVLSKLGDVQVALNKLADAQTQYQRVLESVPERDRASLKTPIGAAYQGLSRIYAIEGNTAAARALARKYPWAKP